MRVPVARLARAVAVVAASLSVVLVLVACADDSEPPFAPSSPGVGNNGTPLPLPPLFEAGADVAAPVACGSMMCQAASFRGVTTLAACCANGACGLDLTAAAPYVAVAPVCTPVVNPGTADVGCPSFPDLQGCCRPDHTCGVFVQLSSTLDLGCALTDSFVPDAGSPKKCGAE